MTYGLNITSNEDQLLRATIEALEVITKAMVPGAYLVDTIPMRASYEVSIKHNSVARLTIDTSETSP